MAESFFTEDARVMSKGQVTIPKKVREILGVSTGDRVTFLVDGNAVKVMNSTVYTLQKFQEKMKEDAESVGFFSEDDIAEWITNSRRKERMS